MKYIITSLLLIIGTNYGYTQNTKYQLSTHILDIPLGKPASQVTVQLEKQIQHQEWQFIDKQITDENGRISNFLPQTHTINHTGVYRLTFFTEPYFQNTTQESFYPFIQVIFKINEHKHEHVPITLSPFGYSTYRGN